MTEVEILSEVKKAIGVTGTHLDSTLLVYVREVVQYLSDAGVKIDVIYSSASVGVISRGVCDLWNYGSSGGQLSNYFMQRATQLCYRGD